MEQEETPMIITSHRKAGTEEEKLASRAGKQTIVLLINQLRASSVDLLGFQCLT